jgi:peptide/nickel transport system substrate-binding protein
MKLLPRRSPGRPIRPKHALAAVSLLALVPFATGCGSAGTAAQSSASGVLTIAMTAGEIPNLDTVLSSDQGYEGYRFVGNSLYDALTKFDLKQGDATPKIVPGLASSWEVSKDHLTWTFHLRQGVKFTDGTPFDADAVIYNLDRYVNAKAPQYDATVAASAGLSTASIASYKKVDDATVSITTKGPDAHLDSDIVFLYIASPTALKKYGKDFADHPVGTGPFVFKSETRGQEAIFDANTGYWGGAPKLDELVLKPMPDVSARLAALRSGEVNWAEAPNPDDIAGLKNDGFQVELNSYDHIWPWIFDLSKKPLDDSKVRMALNLAIDRDTMSDALLQGTADPALQMAPKANGAYDTADDVYSYDPTKAKQLLAEAGYPDGFSMTLSYPTSGSGNMQPGPMNQELQSDLAKIGVKVTLKPIEWAAMLSSFASGKIPDGADAINISLAFIQESSWAEYFASKSPVNVGHYDDPKVDELLAKANDTFDLTQRNAVYAQMVKVIDQDAPWLVVVNDRNPRVLAPDVHGFVQPKSWFVDLTNVSVN